MDIKIENVGPVVEFVHPLSEPGLHVLRGRQGCGKSTILRTIERVVNGCTDRMPGKRAAITMGVQVRAALAAQKAADELAERAKRLDDQAQRMRAAASETSSILTDAVAQAGGMLRVVTSDDGDPRLVLSTDRSDREYFDDLSAGERWILVIQIAAANNRLLVLPQAAFGELSHESRCLLHRHAQELGCYIVTAQADDCALRGEPFKC